MRGKRLRMKVLVDEDRLEDQDAIAPGGWSDKRAAVGSIKVKP